MVVSTWWRLMFIYSNILYFFSSRLFTEWLTLRFLIFILLCFIFFVMIIILDNIIYYNSYRSKKWLFHFFFLQWNFRHHTGLCITNFIMKNLIFFLEYNIFFWSKPSSFRIHALSIKCIGNYWHFFNIFYVIILK